jgi:hypothetical protein
MADINAEKEFLDSLGGDDLKLTDDNQFTGEKIKVESEKTDDDDSPRNRRERRFVKEMENIRREAQADREARIRAEERAASILELGKHADASSDPDEAKFYGDTPEGKFAKSYLDRKFQSVKEQAKQEALDEIRRGDELKSVEEQKDSETIDSGFSRVEDEFDVDLSGDTAESKKLRNGFIDFLQDLTTDSYPDFTKSFEVYSKLNQKQPSQGSVQRKALADRSMASAGSGSPQEKKFRSGRDYINYLESLNN